MENDNEFKIYTKGAAEYIKSYCKYYINSETCEKHFLDEDTLKNLDNKIEKYNNNMLRTIYICYKDIIQENFENIDKETDQTDIVLLSIFCIRDTIRNEVKEAIIKFKKASINVIMGTGDNIKTAISIAKSSNIIEDDIIISNKNIFNGPNYLLSNPPKEKIGKFFMIL